MRSTSKPNSTIQDKIKLNKHVNNTKECNKPFGKFLNIEGTRGGWV